MLIEEKIEIRFRGITHSKSSPNGLQGFVAGVGVTFKTNQKYVFVSIIVPLPPTSNDALNLILFSVTSLLTSNSICYHSSCLPNEHRTCVFVSSSVTKQITKQIQ